MLWYYNIYLLILFYIILPIKIILKKKIKYLQEVSWGLTRNHKAFVYY